MIKLAGLYCHRLQTASRTPELVGDAEHTCVVIIVVVFLALLRRVVFRVTRIIWLLVLVIVNNGQRTELLNP